MTLAPELFRRFRGSCRRTNRIGYPVRTPALLTAPVLITALALAATPVSALVPEIQLRVETRSDGDFTVRYASQARLTDYWCAAGSFVTRTLRLPDDTRVYRLSPAPRGAGKGIDFTLDAAKSAGETGLSTFGGRQDGSMSAGVAVAQFCHVFEPDF